MTRRDVRNLVRHRTSQLCFIIGSQDQPLVDIEKSAGEGECVDLIAVDDLYSEGNFCIRMEHDILADLVYVVSNDRVFDKLRRTIDFLRELPPDRYFLVK